MKTKLLFTKNNYNALYLLLIFCLCFNYGWSQTNLILNGAHDLFTVTEDDVDNNPTWTRNDSDNADAFDMSPPSTVIYDADAMSGGATTSSPYNALWNNGTLDGWLSSNCGDGSEQPGSSSDGNFDYTAGPTMGVPTRGVKLNEACRRLYQKVAVTPGVSYTLFLESRSEAMDVDSDLYILNTEIADETGLTGSVGGVVDAFHLIDNDFNSSKSNATTDNFTKTTLVFTPTTSFVVIYVRPLDAIDSSNEVFFDNIELYETSELSTKDFSASNVKVYPNPATDKLTIETNNVNLSSIEIYNLLGKKVLEQNKLSNNTINISNLSNGVYMLKLNSDNMSITKKLIVK